MENLIFLFHFLRLTLLHYIYPNPRLSFHFFILFWLLCAFYYCKSLLPTIGRLDPRVPPDSVLLHSTVKLAPLCSSSLLLPFFGRRFENERRITSLCCPSQERQALVKADDIYKNFQKI